MTYKVVVFWPRGHRPETQRFESMRLEDAQRLAGLYLAAGATVTISGHGVAPPRNGAAGAARVSITTAGPREDFSESLGRKCGQTPRSGG